MSGDEECYSDAAEAKEGEKKKKQVVDGQMTRCRCRGSHSHLCGISAGCRDGPSAAFGVEVEQGAARETDDKLGPVGEMTGRSFEMTDSDLHSTVQQQLLSSTSYLQTACA